MANVDKTKFKSIPVSACQMALAEIDVQQNSDDAKSAPIKLKARSSKPIKHPFWGNVVHDMSGLVLHKTRLAIDYNHDANLIIGYLNKFETSEQDGLVASGALTPNKFNQMAQAVIANLDDGVPYESSINFGGDDLEIEIVGDGETALLTVMKLQARR